MNQIMNKLLLFVFLILSLSANAAVKIAPDARQQYMDSNGDPCSGCLLYTYVSGSTANQATFTDSTGGSSNTNPIVLNGSGYTPSGLWLTEGLSYKFTLKTAADVTIWTEDNIDGVNDASLTIDEWISSGLAPTFVNTTSFTLVGDQTSVFHVGRRLKLTDSGGDDYCTISTTAFTSLTTVTVTCDASGVLDSGLSIVSYGIISAVNTSVNSDLASDLSPQLAADLDSQGFNLDEVGVINLIEQADADADVAGRGQLWVNTATPNELYFTNDAGTDIKLGRLAQAPVNVTTGAVATGTTQTVNDDSIPQNTEGNEWMTLAITPISASNILVIEAQIHVSSSSTLTHVMALFQDSTASALASSVNILQGADAAGFLKITHYMVAGTTSPTTFKVRSGAAGGGTITFNGSSAARTMGGSMSSYITIMEYAL